MKKLICLLLALLMLTTALPTVMAETSEDGFTYEIENGEVTVTGYRGASDELVIPDTLGGYPVTVIGEEAFFYEEFMTHITIPNSVVTIGKNAFSHCKELNEVTIPDSVTTIEKGAFSSCKSLTQVTIPASVTTIGGNAFYDCTSLSEVTIGNSVTTIGQKAFYYCLNLTEVTIPASVTTIGERAFSGCGLTNIIVNANNQQYADSNGVLFNKAKTELIQYPIGKKDATYIIPDSVTTIGGFAFHESDNLTEVTIPDSVTSIGEHAFSYCLNLTEVTISNSVTTIGEHAFYHSKNLTEVTIPNSVTTIGADAFGCCDSLTEVTIPDSVTAIGEGAFGRCASLTNIIVNANNQHYADINGVLLNKAKTELIQYPIGKMDVSYIIPDSVITIGNSAFAFCDNLMEVTIPDSVTTIRKEAFLGCDSLTELTIPASVTTIEDLAFTIGDLMFEDRLKTIYGYAGTEAERYATDNGIIFVALDQDEKTVYGDLNGDGTIGASDALEILKFVVGKVQFTQEQQVVADVSGSDGITAADALLVLKIVVGKIQQFPVEQ